MAPILFIAGALAFFAIYFYVVVRIRARKERERQRAESLDPLR